ncbi:MAG TPA: glycosyltransferase family 4 protein [Ignavibacteria bacterium]|nr:glycosyl transferase family 1 [Bacteroidota bacterium]HRI84442.1 glycosyltransferase family 4 protein [Ignavibacteria bacterium]HRJ98539.1 glycosyltransferase family 4 protein [Ignavibacteria bacterium]
MILYAGNILSKHGFTPTVIESLTPKLRERYDIISVSDKKNQILRMLDMIYGFLKYRKKLSVVLIDSYSMKAFWFTYILAILCKNFNIPYIPILHGGGYPDRFKSSPEKCNLIFRNSYRIVSPSLYLKEFFEGKGFEVTYIPNFIHINNYRFKKRDSAGANILWVRSFHETYNPMLAVEILKELVKKYPDAKLCMIGPEKDDTLNEVKKASVKYKLNGSLIITGKLTRKEWTDKSADYDIFINTTNYDNQPVSVIEAMALGFPIVSTNVGGIPFLITDKKDGLLVPPENKERFIEEIEKLISDDKLVSEISSNARKKAEELDWEQVKYKWFEILDPAVKI